MSAGSFGSQGPQTAEDCGDPKPPEDHQVSCVGEHLRGIRQGSQGRRTRISQGVPPAASVTGKNVINKQGCSRYRKIVSATQIQSRGSSRHAKYLYYSEKVSFAPSIPKNWLFETDTDPKNGFDPGSTETVSRSFPALIISDVHWIYISVWHWLIPIGLYIMRLNWGQIMSDHLIQTVTLVKH